METLHDRIGRVINTEAFERRLEEDGVEIIDFQGTWYRESKGDFAKLQPIYQEAILAGERELTTSGEVVFA